MNRNIKSLYCAHGVNMFRGFPSGSGASLMAQWVKNPPAIQFNPWDSKISWRRAWQPIPVFLPGKFPWTEEPGGLQPLGSQRVRHDWATKHSTCGSDNKESVCSVGDPGSIPGSGRSPGVGNGYSLQYSCLGNSMDRGAWQTTVHRIAKESDTTEVTNT